MTLSQMVDTFTAVGSVADITMVAELLAVFLIISFAFLVSYKYVYHYEASRRSAGKSVDNNLARMLRNYLQRGGVKIRTTLINRSLPAEVSVLDATGGLNPVYTGVVADFVRSAKVELYEGSATLKTGGKEFSYECSENNIGANVKLLVCGLKNARFENAVVSSVISGIVSDGRFTGSITFTIKV